MPAAEGKETSGKGGPWHLHKLRIDQETACLVVHLRTRFRSFLYNPAALHFIVYFFSLTLSFLNLLIDFDITSCTRFLHVCGCFIRLDRLKKFFDSFWESQFFSNLFSRARNLQGTRIYQNQASIDLLFLFFLFFNFGSFGNWKKFFNSFWESQFFSNLSSRAENLQGARIYQNQASIDLLFLFFLSFNFGSFSNWKKFFNSFWESQFFSNLFSRAKNLQGTRIYQNQASIDLLFLFFLFFNFGSFGNWKKFFNSFWESQFFSNLSSRAENLQGARIYQNQASIDLLFLFFLSFNFGSFSNWKKFFNSFWESQFFSNLFSRAKNLQGTRIYQNQASIDLLFLFFLFFNFGSFGNWKKFFNSF